MEDVPTILGNETGEWGVWWWLHHCQEELMLSDPVRRPLIERGVINPVKEDQMAQPHRIGSGLGLVVTTAVFWLAYLHKSGSDVSHWLNLPLLWAAAGNTNTTPDFSILFSDTVSILINWIARTSQWIIWPNRVMLAASSITITTVWSQSYCFNQWLRCCSGRCKFRSQ